MLCAVTLPGCGGCRKPRALKKEPVEEPKPPFELLAVWTQPSGLGAPVGAPLREAKPGHWSTANVDLVANRGNFRGELATGAVPLEHTPHQLQTLRPAILPKEQRKRFEVSFYLPTGRTEVNRRLLTRLSRRGTSGIVVEGEQPVAVMPAHKFHMLVLAGDVDRYRFLVSLPSIANQHEEGLLVEQPEYYQVLLPRPGRNMPLAGNPLVWTSLAYIVWDDFDAGMLTGRQQVALVDWLHWGGQLIISGPTSLAALRGSFLEPYLPASGEGTLELGNDELGVLSFGRSGETKPVTVAEPWTGERLAPADGAETLVANEAVPLVVARRVGRGRIVVTAFGLAQRELLDWPGHDAFWNEVLLDRPPRGRGGWLGDRDRFDPALVSKLRLVTRDAGSTSESKSWRQLGVRPGLGNPKPTPTSYYGSDAEFDSYEPYVGPGVCGWDDFNVVADAARQSLQDAALITIPRATFVLRLVGIYLVVLVPLNWLTFRLMGRVEWAWFAVPVISVVFALVVVRLAQLDIGFVRARTEVGVAELFAGHPRAHLTRYTALYSSLSTSYDARFDDDWGLAQPFASRLEPLRTPSRSMLTWRTDRQAALEGFRVVSNSTGMLHSEQVTDIGGSVELSQADGTWRVTNGTPWTLQGTGVVGPLGRAWIGTLAPGEAVALNFKADETSEDWSQRRRESLLASAGLISPHHQRLFEIAEAPFADDKLTMRLVAWIDEPLPGITIEPAASQGRYLNLVVVHLATMPRDIELAADERDVPAARRQMARVTSVMEPEHVTGARPQ